MNTNPPKQPSLPPTAISPPTENEEEFRARLSGSDPFKIPEGGRLAVDIENIKQWIEDLKKRHRFPWYVWVALFAFAFVLGGIASAVGYHYHLSCEVDQAGYVAKTAVCTDQQAYALIPMSVDVRLLEQKLASLKQELTDCQGAAGAK